MAVKIVSEGPARITKATIEAAWKRRAQRTRLVIRDDECRGLALVVNATTMSWVVAYKPRGVDPITGSRFPTRSVTIGGPATHAPDQARSEANRLKDRAKGGADPAQEKRAKQAADVIRRAMTVSRLVEAYALDLPKRPKMRGAGLPSPAYVAAEIAQLKAAVASMKASDGHPTDISAARVRALVKAEGARPALARHRFGAMSRFLDWCMDEGHVPLNVCVTIGKDKRPRPPAPRSRYLSAEQVAVIWNAAAGMSEAVHRDYGRFLLAVPCRRNEAGQMDWAHVDLDAAAWSQPDKMTKNGEPHRFHLPELALSILRARWEVAGKPVSGLVFPSPKSKKALTTHTRIKAELDKLAGFAAWSWHDMRRSFATTLGEAGFSEAVADAVLNHRQAATRGGVLGVYQHAERRPERKAAMEAWAATLQAAIDGKPARETVADFAAARSRRASA
jgi:integrase